MSGKCSNCGTQYFGTGLASCQRCGFALTPHAMNPDPTTPAPEGESPYTRLQDLMEHMPAEQPAQSLPQETTGAKTAVELQEEFLRLKAQAKQDVQDLNQGRGEAVRKGVDDIIEMQGKKIAASQREGEKLREEVKSIERQKFLLWKEWENELQKTRSSLATKDAQIVELREQFAGAVEIGKSHRDEADALRAELSALIAESMSISEGCESRIAALKTECERLKKEVDQARASLRAFVKLAKDHHAKITANNKALTARAEAAEKEIADSLHQHTKTRAAILAPSLCGVPGHFRFQINGGHCTMCQKDERLRSQRDAALALVETCRKALDKIANDERVGPWQSNPGLNERHIAKNVLASLPVAGTDKRTTPDRSNWTQDDAEEAKLP